MPRARACVFNAIFRSGLNELPPSERRRSFEIGTRGNRMRIQQPFRFEGGSLASCDFAQRIGRDPRVLRAEPDSRLRAARVDYLDA